MNEKTLNADLKKWLKAHHIMFEKNVSSMYQNSGKSDLTIYLPNHPVIYVELKGFNSRYQLSMLQKIFLLQNSQVVDCWYINSLKTYQNFKNHILQLLGDKNETI